MTNIVWDVTLDDMQGKLDTIKSNFSLELNEAKQLLIECLRCKPMQISVRRQICSDMLVVNVTIHMVNVFKAFKNRSVVIKVAYTTEDKECVTSQINQSKSDGTV